MTCHLGLTAITGKLEIAEKPVAAGTAVSEVWPDQLSEGDLLSTIEAPFSWRHRNSDKMLIGNRLAPVAGALATPKPPWSQLSA